MPYEKEEDEVNSEQIQDDNVGLKRKTPQKTDLLQLFERLANEIKLERASRVGALFCVRVFH